MTHPIDSLGDLISLKLRWLETHEFTWEECALCKSTGHDHPIAVCVVCEHPPAMDGKCLCDWEVDDG